MSTPTHTLLARFVTTDARILKTRKELGGMYGAIIVRPSELLQIVKSDEAERTQRINGRRSQSCPARYRASTGSRRDEWQAGVEQANVGRAVAVLRKMCRDGGSDHVLAFLFPPFI
jgi:hypothetical protein